MERDPGPIDAAVNLENLRLPITHPSEILLGAVSQPVFEPCGEPCPDLELGMCGLCIVLVGQPIEHYRGQYLRRPAHNHELGRDGVGLAVEIEVGFDRRVGITAVVKPALHPPPARLDPAHGNRVTGFELQPPVDLDLQNRALGMDLDLRHPRSESEVDDDIGALGRFCRLDPQPFHVPTRVERHDDLSQALLVEMSADLELEYFDDGCLVHGTGGFDSDARHDRTFDCLGGDRNQEESDRERQQERAVHESGSRLKRFHRGTISRDAAS